MSIIKYFDQNVYLGAQRLQGVQSASFSTNVPHSPVNVCGSGLWGQEIQGEVQANLSIGTIIVTQDSPLADAFASKEIVWHQGDAMGVAITGARLSEYTVECGIGAPITENLTYSIYGPSAGAAPQTIVSTDADIMIAKPAGVTISIGEFTTNDVTSLTYRMSPKYKTHWKVGAYLDGPETELILPIEVGVSVSMDVRAFSVTGSFEQVCSPRLENITILIENPCGDGTIRTLKANGARFISTAEDSDIGGNLNAKLEFVAYANSAAEAQGWLT